MITPERVLMWLAAEAGRQGLAVPQLDTEQARTAAERLIAAAGLARVEPPRELPAEPARLDTPTQLLPLVQPHRGPVRGVWR